MDAQFVFGTHTHLHTLINTLTHTYSHTHTYTYKPNRQEVSIDDVVEKIEAMEDQVQSVDISSFNKL